MELWELLVIAVGLSMDAFAIAICKGLSVGKIEKKHFIITGLWFGGAQAIMPLIGYLLGTGFQSFIEQIDHWIAFVLLGIMMLIHTRMVLLKRFTRNWWFIPLMERTMKNFTWLSRKFLCRTENVSSRNSSTA